MTFSFSQRLGWHFLVLANAILTEVPTAVRNWILMAESYGARINGGF